MRVIHKYPIPTLDSFIIDMPRGAYLLHVGTQGTGPGSAPQIWASVDPTQPFEGRKFKMLGTGHPYEPATLVYLGSFFMEDGNLVFHVFEDLAP